MDEQVNELLTVSFHYKDGTVVTYKETPDYFFGDIFYEKLANNDKLKPEIIKKFSPTPGVLNKITNFIKNGRI